MKRTLAWGLAGLLLTAHLLLSALLLDQDSITIDEPIHITAGTLAVKNRDLRINREHPPLAKALAGLGVITRDVSFPYTAESYTNPDDYRLTRRFFLEPGNDPLALIARARWPLLLLSLLFALFLFLFVQRLFGVRPALVALLLYTFSPTVLGHNHLVTTDSAAMIFCFAGTALSCLALDRRSYGLAVAGGIVSGLAMLSKFSGLILLPVTLLTGSVFLLYHKGHRVRTLLVCGCIVVMSASTVLWGCWALGANTPGGSGPFWQYLDGLRMVREHVIRGHNHPQFLLGRTSHTGWWAYFPAALALKTSMFLQFLLLMGVWQAFRKTPAALPPDRHCLIRSLFLFPICYALYSLTSRLNIGFRHMMPVLPFLFLFIGVQTDRFLRSSSRAGKALVLFLLTGFTLSTLWSYPGMIGYFTEWARRHPERFLNDSNLDWGQDLGRLASFMEIRGIQRIYLDTFSPDEAPDLYLKGRYERRPVDRGLPEAGWFAVSEFFIMTSRFNKERGRARMDYTVLEGIEPEARVGSSIRVYHFP